MSNHDKLNHTLVENNMINTYSSKDALHHIEVGSINLTIYVLSSLTASYVLSYADIIIIFTALDL